MPELDRENLENEFNISQPEVLEPEIVDDIEPDTPDQFELEWEEDNEDSKVLRNNIERANETLDQITDELNNGNFSARLAEVAGSIINSITSASKVLLDNTNYNKYLDIRKSLAMLKQREVIIKELNGRRAPGAGDNNLIIASREDVLKLINEKKKKLD